MDMDMHYRLAGIPTDVDSDVVAAWPVRPIDTLPSGVNEAEDVNDLTFRQAENTCDVSPGDY
jgi:hypothetical protein